MSWVQPPWVTFFGAWSLSSLSSLLTYTFCCGAPIVVRGPHPVALFWNPHMLNVKARDSGCDLGWFALST